MSKNFRIDPVLQESVSALSDNAEVDSLPKILEVPSVTTVSTRRINYSIFYGKGYDEIIRIVFRTVESMLADSINTKQTAISISTVVTYARNIKNFFQFLECKIKTNSPINITDINKVLVSEYVLAINSNDWSKATKRASIVCLKSLLVYAEAKSLIGTTDIQSMFPKNLFRNSKRKTDKQKLIGLSVNEKTKLVSALRCELQSISSQNGEMSFYDLSICAIYIILRTGINLTPILELSIDCIQPHPLKQELNLLVCFKRRGHNHQVHALKGKAKDSDNRKGISADVAALIEMITERNADVRSKYKDKSRLFVYNHRPLNGKYIKPGILTFTSLYREVDNFSKKHALCDDDGKPLQLNANRLRKTYISRIWELSGQNPMIAARYGKHTVALANKHYWSAPPEAEGRMRLLQEMRVNELRQHNGTDSTPIAKCSDIKNGHRAPKDGSTCTEILGCFRCMSFVVTADDLYRLYSFYWAAIRDQNTIQEKGWKKYLRKIIHMIDEEIAPKFSNELVTNAREKAKSLPHPFWKDLRMIRMAR